MKYDPSNENDKLNSIGPSCQVLEGLKLIQKKTMIELIGCSVFDSHSYQLSGQVYFPKARVLIQQVKHNKLNVRLMRTAVFFLVSPVRYICSATARYSRTTPDHRSCPVAWRGHFLLRSGYRIAACD